MCTNIEITIHLITHIKDKDRIHCTAFLDTKIHIQKVNRWEEGWRLSWHGTTLYGLPSALYCGFVAPSEKGKYGHATACDRGTYTSVSFMGVARHAAPMLLDLQSCQCVTVILLCAIPGKGGKRRRGPTGSIVRSRRKE